MLSIITVSLYCSFAPSQKENESHEIDLIIKYQKRKHITINMAMDEKD